MSFTRANPLGWAMFEVLTSAQMNVIDTNQSRALDGNAGGDYSTIAADIVFNGAQSIAWGTGRYPKLASRVLTRVEPMHFLGISAMSNHGGTGTDFDYGSTGAARQVFIDIGGSPLIPHVLVPIRRFVDLAVIQAVRVKAKAATIGRGAVPTTPPKFDLLYYDTTDTATVVGTKIDPSASVPAYEAIHDVDLTGLAHQVDGSNRRRYFVKWYGEGGPTAAAGLLAYSAAIEYVTTLVTPGG